MIFGKKTKIYAPNISANVQADADVDAKMKKGGEKLLTKMSYGGGIDMSQKLVNTMRGAGKKMKIGGSTYSRRKKK